MLKKNFSKSPPKSKKNFSHFWPKIYRFWPKSLVEWFFMVRINVAPVALVFMVKEAGPWTAGVIFCLYVHLEKKDFKIRKDQRFFNKWVESRQDK